ncbi:hypothetical protein DERP_007821 [Dermatophagoides pteronyssinus]|uniref:Uncharacterized protein n=1 Tax=Dermatophagoides pteronyssinus TaxID=6956 RepID=A0ABQ8ISP1_DERPT|nr:hypothetical protein DERP_007821 [Dermatophagoides pteronyssinus]
MVEPNSVIHFSFNEISHVLSSPTIQVSIRTIGTFGRGRNAGRRTYCLACVFFAVEFEPILLLLLVLLNEPVPVVVIDASIVCVGSNCPILGFTFSIGNCMITGFPYDILVVCECNGGVEKVFVGSIFIVDNDEIIDEDGVIIVVDDVNDGSKPMTDVVIDETDVVVGPILCLTTISNTLGPSSSCIVIICGGGSDEIDVIDNRLLLLLPLDVSFC